MARPSSPPNSTVNNRKPSPKSKWHYHPPIPIDNNPIFSWPIRWKDTLIYYRDSWLVVSEGTKACVRIWHQKAGAINPLIPRYYVAMTLLSAGAL